MSIRIILSFRSILSLSVLWVLEASSRAILDSILLSLVYVIKSGRNKIACTRSGVRIQFKLVFVMWSFNLNIFWGRHFKHPKMGKSFPCSRLKEGWPSQSLEQFIQTVKSQNIFQQINAFLTCSRIFLISNILEHLLLEKILGFRNMQEKMPSKLLCTNPFT